jgi:tetratricopeptide (TPR) repeat protein
MKTGPIRQVLGVTGTLAHSAALLSLAFALCAALGFAAAADDMSDCRAATKDADAMLAACSRVIEAGKVQDSELSAAHVGRGLALRRKGEFERAIAEYNEATRLAPEPLPPSGNLGRAWVFVDLGQPERAIADWDAAISYYDKIIANSPDSAQWPYAGRAGVYGNKGELDRAIADYGESIRIRPADPLSICGVLEPIF